MVRSFLLYVLFSFSLMHATNVCSAAWYDNKLVHAVSCVFSNKKLFEAIASLQEAMQEINDKNIKHLRTDVLCDFHIGDHRYIHKNHYYTGGSEGIELVKRYKDALDHFETVYPLLEVRDAAFLGALTAMINEQLEGSVQEEN